VKLTDQDSGNKYMWEKSKFLVRQAKMMELFYEYDESGEEVLNSLQKVRSKSSLYVY